MLASRTAAAGFVLALAATLFHFVGFGYDEVRRPFILLGAALVLAGGVIAARTSPNRASLPLLLSDLALLAVTVSAFLSPNSSDAVAALFPVVTAWVFFRGVALGWIPREFLERRGLVLISWVGILFSGYGLIQAVGWDPLGFSRDTRLAVSTIGNTNYAGILSAALALAGLAGALFESGLPRRLAGAAAALLGGLHVAVSGSLAGLLGLAAGVVVFAALLVRRWGWRPVVIFPLVILAAAIVPTWSRLSARLSAISKGEDRTSRIRQGLWKGAARLAGAHPILGCGAGGFSAAFPPFRDADERRLSQESDPLNYFEAEDPHNSYLAILAESGPVALLAVFGVLVLSLISGFRRAREPSAGLAFAAVPGLAALAVSGAFNSLPGHLPFAVLAGVLAGVAGPAIEPGPSPSWRRIPMGAAAALLAVAWIPWLLADIHYRAAMYTTSKPDERIRHARAAVDVLAGHWQARYQIAYCWRALGEGEGTVRAELREILRVRPHHVPSMLLLARGAEPGEEDALLRRAEELAPESAAVRNRLITRDIGIRDFASARRRVERMLEALPDDPEGLYTIARLWIWEGKPADAIPWLERAIAKDGGYRARLAEDHPELIKDSRFKELVR